VPFPNRLLAASTKRRDNQGVRTADHHLGCVPCVRPCPKAHRRQRARTSAKNRTYSAADPRVGIDGNGNLVSEGREWDARDRLVSGGYGYDTGNLRVKMGEQTVLLDGIEEAREYGGVEARYEHDPWRVDALLAQTTSAGKGYFVTDALGSVYGVVDSTGAEVSKYSYDVYGVRTATTEGMPTSWGFTGRRHDSSTEMYYRARYLDAQSGVFQSRDPISWRTVYSGESLLPLNRRADGHRLVPVEILLSLSNEYQYGRASPAVFEDPSGRYWMEFTNDSLTTHPYTLYLYGNWDSSRDLYKNFGDVLHVAWGAWSGYVETTPNVQCAEGVGPIPAGTYFIWPQELHKSSWLERFVNRIREDDWGAARVGITNVRIDDPNATCQARGGFYLHGGLKPGTAGCIDIGNRGIEEFISRVQGYPGGILLWVHYIGN
jgi:RHS repeat-associated protein